jgi:hypothetical protein
VKAEKDGGGSLRITDDEAREKLTVRSLVAHAAGLDGSSVKTGRLEEDSLLGSPKKSDRAEQQREHNEGNDHMGALRGFQ